MKYTLSLLSLTAASLATPIASSAPPSYKINSVISGGSGCPQGSISVDFSNSGIMPIYFTKDFTATVGPSITADQSRKNCQIDLDLSYSAGWSYAVYNADYTGFAKLDEGVTGTIRATYYFAGQTDQASSALVIDGPFTGKYTKSDDVAVSVWSPCSGNALLNVNAEVALTPLASYNSGILTQVKETGKFTNNLYIKWKQC